jgi:hypothetical protein
VLERRARVSHEILDVALGRSMANNALYRLLVVFVRLALEKMDNPFEKMIRDHCKIVRFTRCLSGNC